ncbi:MAG: DUF2203 domain-containing protein [Chloroflexi bacterium]|nr:DUF2203 domain-containing protein [Chloroflexota bacterium]
MDEHLYSVSEANALLPYIRTLVASMLEAREAILSLQPELWSVIQAAVFNGGSKSASDVTQYILTIQDAIRKLQSLNIIVKDVNTGLIDFPAERDGQLIYLCWLYDEPSVQFWHDVDSGFAGRQRIDETF